MRGRLQGRGRVKLRTASFRVEVWVTCYYLLSNGSFTLGREGASVSSE